MATKIQQIIPAQGFEVVLNRLGAILFEELTAQMVLQSIENELGFFIERVEPYDKSEDVVISVSLNNVSYPGKNQKDVQGTATYFIDVYVSAQESQSIKGHTASRQKLHLFVGMIRYILNCTIYKTLDFDPGVIGGVSVDSIQMDDNYGNQEGAFIRFGRVTYSARVQENQEMWTGVELLGNDSQIKLEDTNKGFKLTFNNN